MNTITRRTSQVIAAALLSIGLVACSEDVPTPTQQIQLPQEMPSETQKAPTPCDDYLHGWERARCTW